MTFAISSRVVLSQPPEGPLAAHIGSFADSLNALGYTAGSMHRQARIAACFSRWLGQEAVTLEGITSGHATRYLRYRARRRRPYVIVIALQPRSDAERVVEEMRNVSVSTITFCWCREPESNRHGIATGRF